MTLDRTPDRRLSRPDPDGEDGTPTRRRRLLQVWSRRADAAVFDDSVPDRTPVDQDREDQPGTDVEPAVFDAELVDDPAVPVLVDQPAAAGPVLLPWDRPADRRPVVPTWLRDRDTRHGATRWAGRHVRHSATYHGVRLPWYGLRLAGRSPRGLRLVLGRTARWALDAETAALMTAHSGRGESADYLKLAARRDDRVRSRVASLAVLAVPALVLAVLVWLGTGTIAHLLLVLGVLLGLGAAGRKPDAPIVSRAVDLPARAARLTSDIVERGLRSLGISALAKGEIRFVAPIVRDGPGWRAEVDVPHGTTAGEVISQRDRLAAGLRRPLGCVWPETAPRAHPGRLVLWVGDEDLATAPAAPWPLAKAGTVDLFEPVPFGSDQRGRPVALLLMFASVLIGAMPGMGKTFALRVLLLAAALDPRAELWLFELKGSGDLKPLEPVAHRYASGFTNEAILATLDGLRAVIVEIERRAKVISGLPMEVCPESKVTPDLASLRRLGLYPLVFAVDECQELFMHPEYGKEAGELAARIMKLGRAFGVILLLATQRPDGDSLPKAVSANVGIRFCLRVMGQVENDMVLGTSAYKNGVRATLFTREDKGVGVLIGGETEASQIARGAYLDKPAAELVIARARAAREAAGTLSGHALGEPVEPADTGRSLVADLVLVFGAEETQAHSDVLCTRLAEQWPSTYDGWAPAQLAAALKPHGISTRQVWAESAGGQPANRRGVVRDDLTAAAVSRAGGDSDSADS